MFYTNHKEKKCPICLKLFETQSTIVRYCSIKCSKIAMEKKRELRRKKYEKQNLLKFGIRKDSKPLMSFICKVCKNKFTRYRSQVKKRGAGFCSVECRHQGRMNAVPTDDQILTLWSKVIKMYDDNKCAYCGKTTYLNSHHIFSRSNRSLRYDLNNGITLCSGCHVLSSVFSAHKTPVEFVEWIKEKRGEEWYMNLRKIAKTEIVKRTKDELLHIHKNLLEIKEHFDDGTFPLNSDASMS